jgi:hypothetical protein
MTRRVMRCTFLLLCLSLAGLPLSVWGQGSYDERDFMDKGSCAQLKGNVGLLVVPVNTPGMMWVEDDVHQVYQSATQSCQWLEKSAAQHGVPLDLFVFSQWGVSLQLTVKDTSLSPMAIINGSIGYDSLEAYLTHVIQPLGFQQVAVLFVLPGRQGSYATCIMSDKEKPYYESIKLMYLPGETSGNTAPDIIIAHELLHLFGAMDFYTLESPKPAIQQLIQGSIMLMPDGVGLAQLEVDAITRYLIGWQERPQRGWRSVFRNRNAEMDGSRRH